MSKTWLDLSDVKTESGDFGLIPEGPHLVQCQSAEIRDTKSKTGTYIRCEFEIVGAEYTGRKLWVNFNITNPNEQAVEIGKQQLKSFLVASGFRTPERLSSPKELEGLSCTAMVKIKKQEGYDDTNVVAYFKPYDAKETARKVAKTTTANSVPF